MAATLASEPSKSLAIASRTVYSCTPILSGLCSAAQLRRLVNNVAAVAAVVAPRKVRRFIMAISPDDGVGFREHYTQNAERRARRNSQKIIIAMGAGAEAERWCQV